MTYELNMDVVYTLCALAVALVTVLIINIRYEAGVDRRKEEAKAKPTPLTIDDSPYLRDVRQQRYENDLADGYVSPIYDD